MTGAYALMGLAVGIGALSLISASVFCGRLRPPRTERACTATLLMATTSGSPRLQRLLQALNEQTLPPRRLLLGIESTADPAFAAAVQLSRQPWNYAIDIVIAGDALHCSQKSWNLIAASQHVDEEDGAVVLLDDDIVPPRGWLSALVSPLVDRQFDLVTGYRWPALEHQTLGSHLVAAIDRTIAILPRPPGAALAWGGSLGMTRDAYERLALNRALAHTLSDDLTIGTAAREQGLRLLTRRALLVPTPQGGTLAAAWSFGQRQYRIMRIYRPQIWGLALLTMTALTAGWLAILVHLRDSPLAGLAWGLLLALAVAKSCLLMTIGRRLGCADSDAARLGQLALALAKPFVDVIHLGMIVAAAHPRRLTWGHVTYRVDGPTRISIEERRAWPDSSS